jgi:hypothetical protein
MLRLRRQGKEKPTRTESTNARSHTPPLSLSVKRRPRLNSDQNGNRGLESVAPTAAFAVRDFSSINFVRRGRRRTVLKKYRSERKDADNAWRRSGSQGVVIFYLSTGY